MIGQKEIELFKALFQKTPNCSILYISNECYGLESYLSDFVDNLNGKLTTKRFIDINLERFRLTAREFEYVVVCDCINYLNDVDSFIKEIYHSLENSANIILIESKEHNNSLLLQDILEKNDFRATNSIDIFENYNLVVAKKMHMWGNGL